MTTFVPGNQKLANMTANKHFNTYKEGLDLKVLRRYCMEYGKVKTFPYGKKLAIQMPYSIKDDTTRNREVLPSVKYAKQHPDEQCLLITYDDKRMEEGVSMVLVWKC